jgi:L-lactate dehydrogenase
MKCTFKVGIVGLGKVGATTAYALLLSRMVTDLVLIVRDVAKATGELEDLQQSLPFLDTTRIVLTDDYEALGGADITVVTIGAAQQPGEDRLALAVKNQELFAQVMPQIKAANPNGLVLVVSNPVDILTFQSYQVAEFQPGQVFGSGTLLDTARFRRELGEIFKVNPRSIHAYVLGEHGDTAFPLLSSANIGGQPLSSFPEYSELEVIAAFDKTKQSAYRIIQTKGATYYAIATVILNIIQAVHSDSKTVMPLSVPLHNYLGVSDVALSVPCVVGARGVERIIKTTYSEDEVASLQLSANTLKQAYNQPHGNV